MPSKIDLSEDSKVSLPAKNLLFILAAVAIGTFSYFNLLERLTLVETELQLISKDLDKANDEAEMPQIQRVDMQVQFLEERIIDLETLVDKLRNNGTH